MSLKNSSGGVQGLSTSGSGVGDGAGAGLGVGVGLGVGFGVGAGVGAGVGDGVGIGVGTGVGMAVGMAVGVGIGVGLGVGVGLAATVGGGVCALVDSFVSDSQPPVSKPSEPTKTNKKTAGAVVKNLALNIFLSSHRPSSQLNYSVGKERILSIQLYIC